MVTVKDVSSTLLDSAVVSPLGLAEDLWPLRGRANAPAMSRLGQRHQTVVSSL